MAGLEACQAPLRERAPQPPSAGELARDRRWWRGSQALVDDEDEVQQSRITASRVLMARRGDTNTDHDIQHWTKLAGRHSTRTDCSNFPSFTCTEPY